MGGEVSDRQWSDIPGMMKTRSTEIVFLSDKIVGLNAVSHSIIQQD